MNKKVNVFVKQGSNEELTETTKFIESLKNWKYRAQVKDVIIIKGCAT